MLKNHNHDLIKQLSEVSSSLWRMDEYMKNAKGCDRCLKIWKKIKNDLEEISKILVEEINNHCKEGKFE